MPKAKLLPCKTLQPNPPILQFSYLFNVFIIHVCQFNVSLLYLFHISTCTSYLKLFVWQCRRKK